MPLTDKHIEEEGICPICRGNGSYSVTRENEDGNIETTYKHCEDCDGSGRDQSNGDFD